MTRRKWTTDTQEEWLKARLPSFADAQANKTTTSEFFPKALVEWRNAWPVPDPTPDEITKAKNVEDAIKKKTARDNDRVKAWFHNHTRRPSAPGNATRGVLKLTQKARFLHEWQVYYQMTYESKWKTIIEKEWETYKSKLTAEDPDTNLKKARFTFTNTFIREKYEMETQEVKDEVKKRRLREEKEGDQQGEAATDSRNKAYQTAIEKLPATLTLMGESIQKQTGWNITFLVGGPEPLKDGKIMTYMLHLGNCPDNKDFEAFLGEEGYEEHITNTFDDFLHKAFPQKVRESRRLVMNEGTPETGGEEAEQVGGSDDGSASEPDDEEKAGEAIQVPRTSKKCEYELTREANIAKNKEILRELKAKFRAPEVEKDASEPKVKKGKKKQQLPIRSSTRIQGASRAPPSTTAASLLPDVPQLPQVPLDSSTAPVLLESSIAGPALSNPATPSPSPLVAPEGVSAPAPFAPAVAPTPSSQTPAPPSTPSLTSDVLSVPPTLNPLDSIVDSASGAVDEGSMDVDVDEAKAVEEKQKTRLQSVASPCDENALPAWLTGNGMLEYLHRVSKEKLWQELVTSLLKFETVNTTTGNLPTSSRPDEVAAWIKKKKKDSPPDVDADEFGSAFMAWWIAIQPKWRLADDSTFNYVAPADENWHILHKGGSAGLYTVVVALSWWVNALTPEDPSFRAWTAVRDVKWVIDEIYKKVAPQGKKRGRDNGDLAAGKGKKLRTT